MMKEDLPGDILVDALLDDIRFLPNTSSVTTKISSYDDITKRVNELIHQGLTRVEGKITDRCWVMSEILTQINKEMGTDAGVKARGYILELCNLNETEDIGENDDD